MLRIPFLLVYQNLRFYKWRKNTNFKFLLLKNFWHSINTMFSWVFIIYWISFEYSGYRAPYFCCTIYIYIFTHIHQIYIYFGRFAAWITYSLITPQYALFLAYKLKYRNFLIFYSACIPTYSLLHAFAGMERFARSQILYYLLYFLYAFLWVQ